MCVFPLQILNVSAVVLANLCVSYIMTSQNEEVAHYCVTFELDSGKGVRTLSDPPVSRPVPGGGADEEDRERGGADFIRRPG